MYTTFLLHGGDSSTDSEKNTLFFNSLISKINKEKISILIFYYARNEIDQLSTLLEKDKLKFTKSNERKFLDFKIASSNIDEVIEQINWADIILIKGGDTNILLSKILKIPHFTKLIEGKIIGGISAGAYIFCKYYYANSKNNVEKGLGIIPISLYTHYDPKLAVKILQLFTDNTFPIIGIPEKDFITIYS